MPRFGLAPAVLWVVLPTVAYADMPLASSFQGAGLRTVGVTLPNGEVSVQAVAGADHVEVSVSRREWSETCKVETAIVGDRLAVSVTRPKGSFGKVCSADIAITAPPELAVDVESSTGSLSLGGMTGGGHIVLGVGSLQLADVSGPLDVKGGGGDWVGSYTGIALSGRWSSGKVRLTGLKGPVDLEVGFGSLDVTWAGVPQPGNIRLTVTGGGLTARFPKGTEMAQDLDGTLGKIRSDLKPVEASAIRLRARTQAGSLRIVEAPASTVQPVAPAQLPPAPTEIIPLDP